MKYLGIDYGLRRIGLAISEGILASPYKVIEVHSLNQAVTEISILTAREKFDQLVVGMPEGETGKKVIKFVKALQGKGLRVNVSDETLSSLNAVHRMIEMGISRKKRRINDAEAAGEILQNYLDNL